MIKRFASLGLRLVTMIKDCAAPAPTLQSNRSVHMSCTARLVAAAGTSKPVAATKRFASIGLLFVLSGCAGAAGLLQNPSGLSGTAAGIFGIPAATVASQVTAEITEIQAVAASLQMLRAQLDGVPVTLPPLTPLPPTPPTPTPPPVPVVVPLPSPPTPTPPGGPIVTPNLRHKQSRRQQEGWPPQTTVGNLAQTKFDWSGSTFYFDKEGRTVALK